MMNDDGTADFWVLFGSHVGGPNLIKIARFDRAKGTIADPLPAVSTPNPGYLVLTPDSRFLYACNQADGYEPSVSGGISAFRFDAAAGTLTPINRVSSHGLDPSHLAFDAKGQHLFVANYKSGSFAVRRLGANGALGEETALRKFVGRGAHPRRQTEPHAHSSVLDPSGRHVLVCDLGTDRIWIFGFDASTGTLLDTGRFGAMPAGSGARHCAFHPNGRWLYVNGEMGNNICRFEWDAASGTLDWRSTEGTLPEGFAGESTTAELLLSPDGRHLFVTNRGHDSIATLAVDPASGDLAPIAFEPTGGAKPRNLAFSPDCRWAIVTNHASDNFSIFAVDSGSGKLTRQGPPISLERPYCPRFVPMATRQTASARPARD